MEEGTHHGRVAHFAAHVQRSAGAQLNRRHLCAVQDEAVPVTHTTHSHAHASVLVVKHLISARTLDVGAVALKPPAFPSDMLHRLKDMRGASKDTSCRPSQEHLTL